MRDFSFVVQKKRRKIHRMQKNIVETFLFNFLLWIDTYYIYWKCCERNSTTFSSNTTFQIFFRISRKPENHRCFSRGNPMDLEDEMFFFKNSEKVFFHELGLSEVRDGYIRHLPVEYKMFSIVIWWMSSKKRLWDGRFFVEE